MRKVLAILTVTLWLAGCGSDGSGGSATGTDAGPADGSVGCTAGKACDDGDPCTSNDACSKGICKGQPKSCDDGLACTTDSCAAAKGCQNLPPAGQCVADGQCWPESAQKVGSACLRCLPSVQAVGWSAAVSATCDDSDPCTESDACQADGTCKGTTKSCDDANACTLDACEQGGCKSTPSTGPCDDGEPCLTGDTCKDGKCQKGSGKLACDDKDPCTADSCLPGKGCTAAPDPKACDDGKPCTANVCDKAKGCSNPDLKPGDACSNGNPCQVGEVCSVTLQCQGGQPLPCDDANPCTDDSCKVGKGCVHALNKAPCDDGVFCSNPDLCTGGACIGVKTGSCPVCNKLLGSVAGKLTLFQIGTTGKPGDGIDVDGNPKTCAPASNCDGGVDNAAAVLGIFLNKPLMAAVQDGSFSFVAELDGFQGEGKPFTLNLYHAELSEASELAGCKPLTQVCEWMVSQSAMSADCKPKFSFPDAMLQGGKLTAGGAGTLFAMDASLLGADNATLYVKGAKVVGEVKLTADGKALESMTGVLGGAVPYTALVDIVKAMDEAVFAQFGLTKKDVLQLVDDVLELDLDVDGDGVPDSASIGLRISGIGAKLVGMQGN